MQNPFSITQNVSSDANHIQIAGPLDETAKLPHVTLRPAIHIDLDKLTTLNSVGTRTWCQWVTQFHSPTKVFLTHCPFIVVKSFGTVRGFLTPEMQITSFYIPYYSPKTGESKDVLAVKGINFAKGNFFLMPDVKDSAGHVMDADVFPESYLAFLKS